MLVKIRVTPNSKKNYIEKDGDIYKIHLSAPAVDGKANKALIGLIEKYFKTKKRNIRIVSGHKSRLKTVEIQNE